MPTRPAAAPPAPGPTSLADSAQASGDDAHAPKTPPNKRPPPGFRGQRGRTLRAGPIAIVGAGLAAAVVLAVGLALEPPSPKPAPKPEPTSATPQLPVVPEAIRQGPTRQIPSPAPARSKTLRAGDWPSRSSSSAAETNAADDLPRRGQPDQSGVQGSQAGGGSILFDVHEGASDRIPAPLLPTPMAQTPTGPSLTPGSGSASDGSDPNFQQRKNQFLQGAGAAAANDTLVATLNRPLSADEIQAGTIIPAVLLTAIDSDLPGPVLAQVRENVYDTVTGNDRLIPQGARLLANYDSMVVWGQERVLVCWNRLIFPNGDSIDLHCMPAADLQGAAGLADQVDAHWMRVVGGAAISSLLAATAQGVAGNQSGFSPSVPQLWASGGAQSVNQTGQQIVRRDLLVAPTITVRAGFSVNVVLTKDLLLPTYEDAP